jgi:ATP-binding cassette subfamily B multidrug efflux pump
MLKLFKYLKTYFIHILIIIVLLFIQAVSDLSLPDYMSNIVNVGIQQGGIESAVPEVIRESEYQKLRLFLSEQENTMFINSYRFLNKDSLSSADYKKYVKKYPKLEDEKIYLFDTSDKLVLDNLNRILGKKLIVLYGIQNASFDKENLPSGMTFQDLPPGSLYLLIFELI